MKKHKTNLAHPQFKSRNIVMFFSLCITPMALSAQTERPDVLVSMYLVSETDACRPNGYSRPDDETPGRCQPLTFDDLDTLVRQDPDALVQHRIPPEKLRLGEKLLDSIDAYTDDCPLHHPCLDSNRRYAIILAFEVNALGPVDCKIRRNPPTQSPIPPYSMTDKLSARGRWITHQRADVFLPAYRVRWLLEIGQWSWDLGTVR